MIKKPVVFLLALLALVSFACNVPASGPTPPATLEPVSSETLAAVEQQMATAVQDALAGNSVTFSITEAELTAAVNSELASQTDLPITNPQVYLRDGQAQVYGQVVSDNITLNGLIVLEPEIDSQGIPRLNLVSVDFGKIPVPQVLLDQISKATAGIMDQALNAADAKIIVESITISGGVMTVTGRAR